MKVLVLVSLVAVASAFEFTAEWEMWKKEHGRDYGSYEEELTRHIIWESNKKFVDNHNENANTFGYTVEMNEYADMTNSEFVQIFNGYKGQNLNRKPGRYFKSNISLEDLPDTVDWRTKGYVTPVKNQGQCGSCWAFSTTGSLEGQHFKATGNLVSLSEQNLVDCSTSEGNEGCNGGLMDDAFEYIIKNHGIDTEASYRYQAHDEKCRFNSANVGATMSSYVDVKSKDESALQQAVATIGPISVAIDASHIGFQLYSGGVYHSYFCSQTRLDHGVLAVGYGTYSGKDYWLVKNSWGASWGLSGYLMMSRNRDNNCGIATQASYPVV